MTRIAVSVEGATERDFISKILKDHLGNSKSIQPVVVTTKRVINGPNHKGGDISLDRAAEQTSRLIHSFDYVTTLYDFYGFKDKGADSVEQLEWKLAQRVAPALPDKFKPYVQKHEFECFMFCNPSITARLVGDAAQTENIADIRQKFQTPEDINDSPATAPSKRLKSIFPQYDKVFHGIDIVRQTGLSAIRTECPRFNSWLQWLEGLPS
jgi:hypothetical protein